MNNTRFPVLVIIASCCLSACSTVIEGTSQEVAIYSSPAGADCVVSRDGVLLTSSGVTPFAIDVDKTKDDINVTCMKQGYLPTQTVVRSDIAAATFGNMVIGGLGGWAVDSMDGADNKYSSKIQIPLTPEPVSLSTP